MYPEEGRSAIAGRGARDLGPPPGPDRRGDARRTSGSIQGGTGQHHSRVVHAGRRGALPRRAEARRAWCRRCSTRFSFAAQGSRTARSRRRCRRATRAIASSRTIPSFGSLTRRSSGAATSRAYGLSGGAADANVFNEARACSVSIWRTAYKDIHTPDERITVADLEGMVEVTLALVDAARDADTKAWPDNRCRRRAGRRSVANSEVDGVPCVAFPRLTGPVALGDEVIVNTQARG